MTTTSLAPDLTNYTARSPLEAGGFRPRPHLGL